MQQYFDVKSKYPDALLLFRVGDFYETFGEDAIRVAKILGIVLTSRNNGGSDIELAGFPYHSLDVYLPRLVQAGNRVAICEQLEKPSKTKKIVKRGVTEMVTPGLAINDQLLDHKRSNYLASLYIPDENHVAIALLDLSTGEFLVSEGSPDLINNLVQGYAPSEYIYSRSHREAMIEMLGSDQFCYSLDHWAFSTDNNIEKLERHFEVKTLKGYGVQNMKGALTAAGAILHYLETTENKNTKHITSIRRIQHEDHVWLDEFTIYNLELLHPLHPTGKSLVQLIDRSSTSMGGRLLRKWLIMPLTKISAIEKRHHTVSLFLEDAKIMASFQQKLGQINDIERMISKVSLNKINPRELYQLMLSLKVIQTLRADLKATGKESFIEICDRLNPCTLLVEKLESSLVDDPPVHLSKGAVIRSGFNSELDELRNIIKNSKKLLLELQAKEAQQTTISSLKIGFNNVFGYYFEVTNKYKNQGLVPDHWVRKQTLSNAERYISDELKQFEEKILTAEAKISDLEQGLYERILMDASGYIQPIQSNAAVIAEMDCLLGFAIQAKEHNYCRPSFSDSFALDLREARHPVIEQQLPPDKNYVANDIRLDSEGNQILLITGPNMSGKSALLRQVAICSLMAQIGSYIPCSSAEMSVVDKIFSRVGASDNISSGESTFMVEMNETASILNNLSARSLILLDEIGRGTSTYDGISIAWSIAEYLHEHPTCHPKTLFATHYHELSELEKRFDRIKNFTIDTRVQDKNLIFLRKLIEGESKHSFGILVAKMAGMPSSVVDRAETILNQLEQDKQKDLKGGDLVQKTSDISYPVQLSLFDTSDPELLSMKEKLLSLDLNTLTPVECLLKLSEWQRLLKEKL